MKFNSQSGLSLIELMIVVAIIGILAALAIPRFQGFQARARQAEAKSNLNHIYTLETTYHGDNDEYVAFGAMGQGIESGIGGAGENTTNCNLTTNPIGFRVTDCTKVRYQYDAAVVAGTEGTAFTAGANSLTGGDNQVFPGCTTADDWEINQDKTLSNTSSGIASCL